MNNTETILNDSFTKTIQVARSAEAVYDAISNFRGWWSEDIDGDTHKLNGIFFYHYKDIHLCKMQLIEAVSGKRLVYRVVENEFNFVDDKTEWVGTRLIFDIVTEDPLTRVTFTHDGLVPDYECYAVCHDAWSGYIGKSLKDYIESGQGQPNPKDQDGFNAALAGKWGLHAG